MVTFQYFSDVHTEVYKSNPGKIKKLDIKVCAPYVILAGDIGDPFSELYSDFLDHLSKLYEYVFLTSGNHEYYKTRCSDKFCIEDNKWMSSIDAKIKEVCGKYPNVIYLQDDVYNIEGTNISVYGATFWTNVKEEEKVDVKLNLMDYQKIPGFYMAKGIMKHKISCSKLEECINRYKDRRFIVISHHLPSYDLINSKYINMKPKINSSYACDIKIAEHPRIVAWVAGHTHIPVQKGKFYVNPIGYPGELGCTPDFTKTFVI